MNARLCIGGLVLCLLVGPAFGQTAGMLSFQALLKDDQTGEPITVPVTFEFRIYDDMTPGEPDNLIAGPFGSIAADGVDGVFSTKFGPVDPAVFNDCDPSIPCRWLEVSIDDGSGDGFDALTRIEMVTAPATAEQLNRPGTGTPALIVDGAGNVGIGTPTPDSRLEVVADGTAIWGESSGFSTAGVKGVNTASTGVAYGVFGRALSADGRGVFGHGGQTGVYGSTSSTSREGVLGFAAATSGTATGVYGRSDSPTGRGVWGLGSHTSGPSIGVRGQTRSPAGYAGYFVGGRNYFQGNVGIGTRDPEANLHVTGATSASLRLTATEAQGGDSNADIQMEATAGTNPRTFLIRARSDPGSLDIFDRTAGDALRLRIDANGNVGIGEAFPAPGNRLVVRDGNIRVKDGATPAVTLQASNFASGTGGLGIIHNDAGADTIYLVGDTNGSGDGQVVVRDSTGAVRINLDAGTGVTTTCVLQITGGCDLAEPFEVSGAIVEPGMVVVIDPHHPGQLTVSKQAYDRKVAGIISGAGGINPGMVMSQRGSIADGSQDVALTGRVYCWCDATNGPIEPGDLLTTSNTPGQAMKVTDYDKAQGAILGKAMTSLGDGQALVLVLVTLQ